MSNYTNFTWVDCSGPTAPLHFHSFSLLPYPLIVPGKALVKKELKTKSNFILF